MNALPYRELDERTSDESIFSFERMKFRYHYACKYMIPGLVLDIGCGLGFGNEYLPAARYQYVGIDYSPETIKRAQQKYPEASFKTMSVPPLLFSENSFDNILCLELIEHLPTEQALLLLRECHRVLKKGGCLFLTTPNAKNRGSPRPREHFYEYHTHELETLLIQQGFSILHQGGLFLNFYKNRYKDNWFNSIRGKLYKMIASGKKPTSNQSATQPTAGNTSKPSLFKKTIKVTLRKLAQNMNWLGHRFPKLAEYQVWVVTK